MVARARLVAAAAVTSLLLLAGCDGGEEGATGTSGVADSTNLDAGGGGGSGSEVDSAAEVSKVDPEYVERVNTQIAELEITAEAMKGAAAKHPNDELLAKLIDRTDKKLPTVKKKVEHLQEIARDDNIVELQAEIDDLLATIADAVDKGVKRAAKLDQMPVREPRQPRERRNADQIDEEVMDEEDDGGGR